jgi:hypothetical protein
MSIDIVNVLETLAGLAATSISLLAVYRSLTIGKSLVSRVYRSRAYWLAVLMIIFAAFSVVPTTSAIESDISDILFFMFLFALLIFIDSIVAVAREIDFFHNDILHWHTLRTPMFAVIVAGTAIAIVAIIESIGSSTGIGILVYFAILGVVFTYSGSVMLAVARRTYDRTLKIFVKMLGFAILSYVLFLTLFIPLDAVYPNLGDVITSFIAIAAAYFFYRAAMSLSPIGRIEKQI